MRRRAVGLLALACAAIASSLLGAAAAGPAPVAAETAEPRCLLFCPISTPPPTSTPSQAPQPFTLPPVTDTPTLAPTATATARPSPTAAGTPTPGGTVIPPAPPSSKPTPVTVGNDRNFVIPTVQPTDTGATLDGGAVLVRLFLFFAVLVVGSVAGMFALR